MPADTEFYKRYHPDPSQVEAYANGGGIQTAQPATKANPVVSMGPAPAAPQAAPPLTQQQIDARRANFITGEGAQAAGGALHDIKLGDDYKTVAARLDSLRRTYGSRREALFKDPAYQDLTRQMAGILQPVDLARGQAKQAARQTFGSQESGYNAAKLAQDAVPATIDQMRAGVDQTRANTGLIDARMKNVAADTGMVEAQTKEVPANSESTRGLQGSEAGLMDAKAENLPRETDAKAQGNEAVAKAQNEALTYRQKFDLQTQELTSLKSQVAELRAMLKDRGVDLVSRGKGFEEAEDRSDNADSTSTATNTNTGGGAFNGSKNPLASNAGGGKVATTQQTAAPDSFTVNPDGTRTINKSGDVYAPQSDGSWRWVRKVRAGG